MTAHDPDKRLTLEQASRHMNTQFAGLPGWRMRWPILPPDASFGQRWSAMITGATTEVILLLRRVLRLLLFSAR
jgi:hypothetical protein